VKKDGLFDHPAVCSSFTTDSVSVYLLVFGTVAQQPASSPLEDAIGFSTQTVTTLVTASS
jgi:hypothetical protein